MNKKGPSKKLSLIKVDAEFDDNLFNGFIPFLTKNEKFVLKDSLTNIEMKSELFRLSIVLRDEQKLSKRKVFSAMDMMGNIGGLYDALFFIIGFLLNSYNASMLDLELVTNIFKFQKTPIKLSSKIQRVSKLDLI